MIGWQAAYGIARKFEQKKDWDKAISLYESILKSSRTANPKVLYRLGNAQFTTGNLTAAETNVKKAISLDETVAAWHYRLGFIHERKKEYVTAIGCYGKAITIDPSVELWHKRLNTCLVNMEKTQPKKTAGAFDAKKFNIDELHRIFVNDPEISVVADALASKYRSSGKRWQEVEVLEQHLPYQASNGDWYYRLAQAYSAMNRHAEAAQTFHIANELKPEISSRYFEEGVAWTKSARNREARIAFNQAIKYDTKYSSTRFGIGVFYQNAGNWSAAAKEYASTVQTSPSDAELQYKLGLALERSYDWAGAERQYSLATRLDPFKWNWHFRHGFSLERMERWSDAASSYSFAAESNEQHVQDWFYRLGFVLVKQGLHQTACDAFLRMRPKRKVPGTIDSPVAGPGNLSEYGRNVFKNTLSTGGSVDTLMRVSEYAEIHGEWSVSAHSLDKAIRQSPEHDTTQFYNLGRALYASGRFKDAGEAFLQMRIFPTAHGIDTKSFQRDKALFQIMQYTSWTENLPIQEDVIFYESFHSDSIGCNPYALYREIRGNAKYDHMRHVWAVKDSTIIPSDIAEDPNTITIPRNSDAYRRYLATAKYLISNVTFHAWFVRRSEQKYLNTWHGTPIKTLGKDIESGFLEHKNVARNFLQATHMLSGNRHTTDVLTKKYDIEHVLTAKIGETGYPRVDQTLNMSDENKRELRSRLQIDQADSVRPTILYAPTWRGGLDTRHFDVERLVNDLHRLHQLDANILFQAHHYTEQLILDLDVPVQIVPKGINSNELLAVTDILITDYSSIAFDFLAQDKPLFFYTYDLDDYTSERGLYFEADELPGPALPTIDTLVAALENSISGEVVHDGESYRQRYCAHDDGQASSRAVEFFLEDNDNWLAPTPPATQQSILFHHSFIPNGITTSLQNLIASLDPSRFKSTVVVPAEDSAADPLRVSKLDELPSNVSLIGRTGRQLFTPEEKWIVDTLNRNRSLTGDEQWSIYNKCFAREYRRIFGSSNFDAIIEFEGYSTFWASILSGAVSKAKKSIYLHNDMKSEWEKRFQYLEALFNIYDSFDSLVSVSPSISLENKNNLSDEFSIAPQKFVDCVNQINISHIISSSKAPLDGDIEDFIRGGAIQLVTIGRLSPEKDHSKLLHAIAALKARADFKVDFQLTILGDGPLRSDLLHLITELGLERDVLLGGLRVNPFPILNRSDAFVLSSNHEGQPMVLLEALILGKKILSTDIVGTRYVLRDSPDCLVENSVEGLTQGLLALVSGRIEKPDFNAEEYEHEAAARFVEAIL